MTNEEYQNSIEKIAEHYGYEAQSRQLIEEMAELTVAINKVWRTRNYRCTQFDAADSMVNLFEEIADVLICIEQIIYLLNCYTEVEQEKARKIERQLERMKSDG